MQRWWERPFPRKRYGLGLSYALDLHGADPVNERLRELCGLWRSLDARVTSSQMRIFCFLRHYRIRNPWRAMHLPAPGA